MLAIIGNIRINTVMIKDEKMVYNFKETPLVGLYGDITVSREIYKGLALTRWSVDGYDELWDEFIEVVDEKDRVGKHNFKHIVVNGVETSFDMGFDGETLTILTLNQLTGCE